LPWAETHYPEAVAELHRRYPDDIVSPPVTYAQPPAVTGDQYLPGVYVDEWGCNFQSVQAGVIGEVKAPLVRDWSDLERVRAPRECLTVDLEQVNAFCRITDRFVTGACCARPFERLQFMRGSENLYYDLGERSPDLMALLKIVHDFYCEELELWAGTEIDALNFMDDWGSQRALLISPRRWREIFKPLYRDYVDIAHSHGKKIFMHSDGFITDVIPDLIELGVDAVNSQVFCMGVEELGQRFAGKITFWGEIDRQHLLPEATTDEIEAAVRRAHAAFWRGGGAIAQCEFGAGARPENVLKVFETWDSFAD
jgi:uroporphyrinogen decarboxylase